MDGNPNWRPRQAPQQHPNDNRRGPGDHQRLGPRQRSQNRADNLLGAGQPIRHPRANYNPPPAPRQEEDRHTLVRNPDQGRRDQGGHASEGFRGQRNERDPEGRRRRLENHDVGRNRRPNPQENHHLQQDHAYSRTQGNDQPQPVRRLGYKALEALLDKDPSEVVITLASCSGMKDLLSLQTIKPGFLELICCVLHKACSSKMDRQNVQHLLGMVKDSHFLKICLPQYVVGMMTDPVPGHRQEYPVHIGHILSLLQNLVSVFPASSVQETSMLVSILPASMNVLRTSGVDISEQIEKNLEKIRTIINHLQAKRREGTLKADTYTLVNSETKGQEESYRTMTIYPTYNEVHLDEKPFLRTNMLYGKYESTAIYLDTHFRLLREDFIRPLREGILEILQSYEDKSLRKRRFDDIRIYFDTRIITPLCSFAGIVYKVQFDPKPLKCIRWQNSKRLLYGSLVCMSKDNFETFLFATVSNRELEDLKFGFVQLRFNEQSRAQLAEAQPSDSFLMVETTAYFEAYRHVLEGLQEIQHEDIPFQKYIVQCETEVSEPSYLLMRSTYDFTALMENPSESDEKVHQTYKDKLRAQNINILDPKEWPSKEALHLDESQMKALQLALTKELAIIQGPPGTGKTFVGLKIAQALLMNDHVWQINQRKFPILVVCYTNHALDQFLEGIHKFLCSGIVRVGGRSSSEILKQFTLRELRNTRDFRRNIPLHLRRAYMDIIRQMKQSEQKLHEGGQHLECSMRGVMHERILEKYIEPHHWESLMNGLNDEFICSQSGKQSMILEWLGLGVTAFIRNVEDNPGAENAAGQQEADEEEEGKDEDELIEIAEEADLIQADRVLEDEEAIKSRKKKENDSMKELANLLLAMELENEGGGVKAEDTTGKDQEGGKWEVHRDQKKKMKQKVKAELRKLNAMTEVELVDIWDLWNLDLNSRWCLYRHWLQMYQADIRRKILQHEQEHQEAADRLAELRLQEDLLILRESKVVGMTTTGAAKYRQILQKVEPRIVIVEEAAEVLEAHTITTLSKACKHLILIGDHQQLRPSANVYDLAKNFNLEVSLFERLIRVNMPFVRLNYQHRMRPEIARLLTPHIYEELANHPSVLDYEAIKGVSSNLFFVEHEFLEQAVQDGKSHQNQHEAQFVVELCKYFLCQGYKFSQITILTTYTGQLFSLRKLMPAKVFSGVRVHVVDKYQGEENDIILLSLVRSNREEKVGFLQISNRICVALSRAKKGLYCIGNMKMLGKVPLWSKIIHTLRERGQVGPSLMLCCQNHPDTKTQVSKADDFRKVPEGGCSRPCEFRLSCGHVCTRACHPYDSDHTEFQCIKPCQKVLCADGHRCPQLCFEACEECSVLVRKTIPQCGHLQMVPCSVPAEDFCCKEPCQNILRCGHQCSLSCGEECDELCPEEITDVLKCGHEQQIMCSMKQDLLYGRPVKCKTKCSTTLECGHACPGSCYDCFGGRFHEYCKRPCTRLLICSHVCQEPCTNECPPCQKVCQNRCVHSQCKRKCGETCIPCIEPCEWSCQHYQCSKLCSEPCDRPPCNVPCTKRLDCGHPCIGLCGEPCPTKCRVCHHDEITQIFFGNEDEPDARYVQLEDCGHIFEVGGLDYFMNEKESEEEVVIKLKVCPKCQTPIRKNLRYGTIINQRLEEIERVKERILGPASEIADKRLQLQDQLLTMRDIRRNFPMEYRMMQEKFLASDLSLKTLAFLENLIVFYKRLAELMASLNKIDVGEKEGLRKRVIEIQGWMDKPQHRFTEQELLDLQSEIQRLTLLVELLVRCKMAAGRVNATTQAEIAEVRSVLESSKKFTKEDESLVKTKMMELKESLPCSGLGISEEERVMIVRAMASPQGHWFKCPNNHIYLITECGGATQRGTCPDCKAEIGGENHALLSSNRLASEMDGARHAAWSEMGNNMLNFDLRRLI